MASTSISKTFPSTRPCPRGKGNHLVIGQRQRHWCQRAGQTQTRSPFPSNTRRSIRRSLVGQEFQPEIWRRSRTTDAPQKPEKRRRNQDDPLPEGHCRAFSAVRAFAPGRTSELREARQGVGHRIFVLEGKLSDPPGHIRARNVGIVPAGRNDEARGARCRRHDRNLHRRWRVRYIFFKSDE